MLYIIPPLVESGNRVLSRFWSTDKSKSGRYLVVDYDDLSVRYVSEEKLQSYKGAVYNRTHYGKTLCCSVGQYLTRYNRGTIDFGIFQVAEITNQSIYNITFGSKSYTFSWRGSTLEQNTGVVLAYYPKLESVFRITHIAWTYKFMNFIVIRFVIIDDSIFCFGFYLLFTVDGDFLGCYNDMKEDYLFELYCINPKFLFLTLPC